MQDVQGLRVHVAPGEDQRSRKTPRDNEKPGSDIKIRGGQTTPSEHVEVEEQSRLLEDHLGENHILDVETQTVYSDKHLFVNMRSIADVIGTVHKNLSQWTFTRR